MAIFDPNIFDLEVYDTPRPFGGGGSPDFYKKKKKYLKLEDQPLKHLDLILDKVVSEVYGIIVTELPKQEKQKAIKVVRPYTESKAKIPQVQSIDWNRFESDIRSVRVLLEIYQNYLNELEDEDELLLMAA